MVICMDQMGPIPISAKSYPGKYLIDALAPPAYPAQRAKQEIDYGRRGKGYIFGALRPADGDAFTHPYDGRTIANWVDFLERVDEWIPAEVERVYAIVENLNVHKATDVMLFSLAHPGWEFVFQPKYAAYLNLSEPWWKVLRSLALNGKLKGKRFETWEEVCQAVEAATVYWNTGMLIVTLSCGGGVDGIVPNDVLQLLFYPKLLRFVGCTT